MRRSQEPGGTTLDVFQKKFSFIGWVLGQYIRFSQVVILFLYFSSECTMLPHSEPLNSVTEETKPINDRVTVRMHTTGGSWSGKLSFSALGVLVHGRVLGRQKNNSSLGVLVQKIGIREEPGQMSNTRPFLES